MEQFLTLDYEKHITMPVLLQHLKRNAPFLKHSLKHSRKESGLDLSFLKTYHITYGIWNSVKKQPEDCKEQFLFSFPKWTKTSMSNFIPYFFFPITHRNLQLFVFSPHSKFNEKTFS